MLNRIKLQIHDMVGVQLHCVLMFCIIQSSHCSSNFGASCEVLFSALSEGILQVQHVKHDEHVHGSVVLNFQSFFCSPLS